jgi:hypothetical protein
MATRLSARIRQLEKQLKAEDDRLPMPLPGQPGRVVMLPRRWVEWLERRGERHQDDTAIDRGTPVQGRKEELRG